MGMFKGPKMPEMPKMKAPKMPDTPRLPNTTDPDIEKRARLARDNKRKGRASTLLADRNTNKITKQSLGGASGNNYPGTFSKG